MGTEDNSYDLFLLAPFELAFFENEGEKDPRTRFPLFDAIGEMVAEYGASIYIPHQRIKDDWTPQQVVSDVTRFLIRADLGLVYLGIESTDVGVMIGQARNATLPMVYFYEKGTQIDPRLPRFGPGPVKREIEFESHDEAIFRLRGTINDFYSGKL